MASSHPFALWIDVYDDDDDDDDDKDDDGDGDDDDGDDDDILTSIYFVNWAPFVGRSPSFCCCKAESKSSCKILPRIFIIIMMRIVVTGTDMI